MLACLLVCHAPLFWLGVLYSTGQQQQQQQLQPGEATEKKVPSLARRDFRRQHEAREPASGGRESRLLLHEPEQHGAKATPHHWLVTGASAERSRLKSAKGTLDQSRKNLAKHCQCC